MSPSFFTTRGSLDISFASAKHKLMTSSGVSGRLELSCSPYTIRSKASSAPPVVIVTSFVYFAALEDLLTSESSFQREETRKTRRVMHAREERRVVAAALIQDTVINDCNASSTPPFAL